MDFTERGTTVWWAITPFSATLIDMRLKAAATLREIHEIASS
jgi:hypothetical protein